MRERLPVTVAARWMATGGYLGLVYFRHDAV
jgi:hypothetical protein